MDNSVESNDAFIFKIKPVSIPATAIQRLEEFPACRGELGDVWRCYMSKQSEAHLVAVKSIRVTDISDTKTLRTIAKRIRREAYVWIQLLHDNILPLEGFTVANEFGPFPALVTPWMENGSLNEYLRREVGLSWERKLSMVMDVAVGLQYLHDKDIVHGDLTGNNVLVSGDGKLCIGDFSLSTILAESSNVTFSSCPAGNIRWMAPELLQDEEVENVMTKASDVYSYGCVMMQVFSGHQPYAHITSILAVMGALQRGRKPFSQLAGIGEEIQQFAQLCWSWNREDRPLVADIVESLSSWANIAETLKKMLSQFPVTVTQISRAALTKCDYHPDGLNVHGAALKYKWVVHGSSETAVVVKTLRDNVSGHNDTNKIFHRIRRELYVREKLRHMAILTLHGITAGFGTLPSLVYPWMAGGSLRNYLKGEHSNLSAPRKLDILLEVAHVIDYLHNQNVAHGNLTGDNVLLDGSGRVRITDFSHSVILSEADSEVFSEQPLGDARYTAPECIFTGGQTGAPKPTKAGDVYSYGCVATLVLSGKVPYWWISEESQVLSEKGKGTLPFHPAVEVDTVHLNLVQRCLSAEKIRPSIKKVIYLVLVQHFGAVDLTTSVERPNKVRHNAGGFANVHKCNLYRRDQSPCISTRVDVAVKEIILMNNAEMLTIINRLFREIKLWLELEHENIVPLWGVADGFGSLPALVSPWLENGALTEYLHRKHEMLSDNQKFALLKDIARGLRYLHSRSMIHGDLSGNNVLIDKDGKAKLADFGLSALLPERMSQALLPTNPGGTAPYMAPECMKLDDEGNESLVFSPKSDVYSFGGIMLQVLEGKVPYHYIRKHITVVSLISRGIRPKRPPGLVVGDSDWDFIQRCWLEDIERRPSDDSILEFVEGRARVQS